MIIIKNTESEDLVIKVPGEGDDIPREITLANGEEYEVDGDRAKDILKWNFAAYFEGDAKPDESTDETEEKTAEDTDEVEAETVKVTNDRDFDVEVKYADGEEEVVAIVKSGEEIEVPAAAAKDVKKQIAEAEEPENEVSEEQKALAAEKASLAAEKTKLAKEKAELRYQTLVAEGKLVPAQKQSFMALAAAGASEKITVAEGNAKTVSELLESLIENGRVVKVGEEEGEGGDGKGADDDVELSDEEKKVTELFDNDEADIKAIKKEEE